MIDSVLQLLGLNFPTLDHSTLSRRAETPEALRLKVGKVPVHLLGGQYGAKALRPGEWLVEKHGTKRRRAWRVLHFATDADTGRIVASVLTDKEADDGSQVGPLLDRIEGAVASVTGGDVYAEVAAPHLAAAVVMPPRANAVPSEAAEIASTQRDWHLRWMHHRTRPHGLATGIGIWLARSRRVRYLVLEAHHQRGLRPQTDGRQASEVVIAVDVLNRMLELGSPKYVRIA